MNKHYDPDPRFHDWPTSRKRNRHWFRRVNVLTEAGWAVVATLTFWAAAIWWWV